MRQPAKNARSRAKAISCVMRTPSEEDGAQLFRYGCGAERMDASGDLQQTMHDGAGAVAQHGKEPEKTGEHAVADDAPAHMQDRVDALRHRIDRRRGC